MAVVNNDKLLDERNKLSMLLSLRRKKSRSIGPLKLFQERSKSLRWERLLRDAGIWPENCIRKVAMIANN